MPFVWALASTSGASPSERLKLHADLFSNGRVVFSDAPDIRKHSINAANAGMSVQQKQAYRTPSPA